MSAHRISRLLVRFGGRSHRIGGDVVTMGGYSPFASRPDAPDCTTAQRCGRPDCPFTPCRKMNEVEAHDARID